jgi:hypothetical protein
MYPASMVSLVPYETPKLNSDLTVPDMSPGPRLGTLVWTGIEHSEPFDFRVQTYKGQPHLTFFLGKLLNGWNNPRDRVGRQESDRQR